MGDTYPVGTSSSDTDNVISFDVSTGVWKHIPALSLPAGSWPKALLVPEDFASC